MWFLLSFIALSILPVLHFQELLNSNFEINSILLASSRFHTYKLFFTFPLLPETMFVNFIKGNNAAGLSSSRFLNPYSTLNTVVTERYSSQVKTLK